MLKDKDSKQSIQVTIRVRPLSDKEKQEDPRICVHLDQSHSLQLTNGNEVKKFTFDSISYEQSQQQIFERVGRRCTKDCLEGYNCTIFAYGQTGAGKTYTMMGVNADHQKYQEHKGLIPRTMSFLFECIERQRAEGVNFIIRCSFLEIYNQQIIDLLNKNNTNLQLREDTRKGVYVEGITEEVISRSQEIMELLLKGAKSRHVGSTFYNETSSRSHSVFTMQIESRYTKNGVVNTKSRQFNFIDLAGSERTKLSTGDRLKEGCNINKSLMNLASVINALSEVSEGKAQHVNYRNSKLTFLLKDSLGGNSKTDLIANISPSALFYQETLSTLSFARRAKLIKRVKASINQDSSGNLDSMKNQIKRLKQEVITLMSRLQSGQGPERTLPSDSAPQMTTIMHEYVSQEIDKQTSLEMEILRLKQRIANLQTGIKHYSSNQTHLRMIISVLEDKIARLKNVETRLSVNIDEMASNEDEAKIVKEYFDSERVGFIKQLQALKGQTQSTRIIKEMLKQAKVMRQDGDQQQALKELLTKNTTFLTMIHSRLQQLVPEKQQIEFNTEFEKKVTQIEIEYHKKEQELLQRMEQSTLQLEQAKNRVEENEKLLEEAINLQIVLEEKNRAIVQEKEEAVHQLKEVEARNKGYEEEIKVMTSKNEEKVAELKNQVTNLQMRQVLLKKQIDGLKAKIEKLMTNQKILKEEFDSLEEEKYKLDKLLLENIQEMKEQKNLLMKSESQKSILMEQVEQLQVEKKELSENYQKVSIELLEQKKANRAKTQQMQRIHKEQWAAKLKQEEQLLQKVTKLQQLVKSTQKRLNDQTEQLEILAKQYQDMENQMKGQLENKEIKIKELSALINQKEENGNEVEYHLNKLKAEIINLKNEKQNNESKLKKALEDVKEKLAKEHQNFELLEIQASERAKLYEELSFQNANRKKEAKELAQKLAKMMSQNVELRQKAQALRPKIENYQKEIEAFKQKQRQQKVQAIQIKNQLFMAQKNSEIEIDAVKSQLNRKQQQIEQIQRQHSRYKIRYQQQITELQKQLQKSKEIFEEHEKSMKKSMENHLLTKEKKLSKLRTELNDKENVLRQAQINVNQMTERIKLLQAEVMTKESAISQLKAQNEGLKTELQQLSNQHNQALIKHEKELEESELIHNDQLDQKNESIENLMNQVSQLTQKIQQREVTLMTQQQKLLYERQQKATIEVQLKSMLIKAEELTQTVNNLHQQVQQLENDKQTLQEKVESAQNSKQTMVMELARLNSEVSDNQKQEQCMNEERTTILKELEIRSQQIESLQVMVQKLRCQIQQKNSTNNIQIHQLNQTIAQLHQRIKMMQCQSESRQNNMMNQIYTLQASHKQTMNEQLEKIHHLQEQKYTIGQNLKLSQLKQMEAAQKLQKLNVLTNDLSKILEDQKQQMQDIIKRKQTLEARLKLQQKDILIKDDQISALQHELKDMNSTIQENLIKMKAMQQQYCLKETKQRQLHRFIDQLQENNRILQITNIQLLEKNEKQLKQAELKLFDFQKQYDNIQTKLALENQQNISNKQKCESLTEQIHRLNKIIEEDKLSKERLYNEVCRERQNNNNFKLIIENSEAQLRQLEVELEEKDAIYKKLLEKIAKNQNQNKKATTSEHYLKTIELLEKSRAEQLNLRRENQDLKKIMTNLKENMEQKENYIREVQKKSQGYCVSMHKRLEQIQKDYFELERNQERLIKEKKALEKCSTENDNLKEEIRTLKTNANKMVQRQEQLETRFKKCNIDYIELEKQFEQLKKGQILITNHDDKTNYINRLKAEVAALKTEKVLLTDSLNREREQKTKLKAEMRFGKDGSGDITGKVELQKKINENKNLQELIFEIVSHLKICVNEPKTKLETIRSVILGTIKQKNNEVKILKERIKELEEMQIQGVNKVPGREAALKEFRGLNSSSYSRNMGISEQKTKFQKEKDPSILDNQSRQKMREFENYYARFKQGESVKYRNM